VRRVMMAAIGHDVSALGLGCASLGSRIGAHAGIKALDRAFDAGITWFDVAPSYGDGQAERIVGCFQNHKRDRITVCTKVGIQPGGLSWLMYAAKPMARAAIALAPSLRKWIARARLPPARIPLTGPFIEASITESLRRLRTDYVDVLALHDPTFEDICRHDVLKAIDNVVVKGYARAISIAGTIDVALAAIPMSERFRLIQFANNLFSPGLEAVPARLCINGLGIVTHSAFGGGGAVTRLRETLESDRALHRCFREAGYEGSNDEIARAFLLDYALATNRAGVVLVSAFDRSHLKFNAKRVSHQVDLAVIRQLSRYLP
jgi:aryl-alcohol dehydrogenase-like predicted oxidoreductase